MSMQVFTALVRDGAIVPDESVDLPEGARVTVISAEEVFRRLTR
jgi:predicted DNA-binding antitoxin AbrB/MazE fold protein